MSSQKGECSQSWATGRNESRKKGEIHLLMKTPYVLSAMRVWWIEDGSENQQLRMQTGQRVRVSQIAWV